MSKRRETFEDRLRLTDEQRARIDERQRDPNWQPSQVDWLDMPPDPFGMDWKWATSGDPKAGAESPETNPSTRDVLSDERDEARSFVEAGPSLVAASRRPKIRRKEILWGTGIAASIALLAIGTWVAYSSSHGGPLLEHQITAWVTERLEPGKDGLRITAPAEEDKGSENPLINHLDRPVDAQRPSSPNLYAPLRVQEQLIIPDVPETARPGALPDRPMRKILETVRPGSLFYLEASTAATPSVGTAVVVRFQRGSWRLLWDEIAVSPSDGTCYFGPIKMEDEGADYFVIIADRTSSPLLKAVGPTLPVDGSDRNDVDAWKTRMAIALKRQGRVWFGMQQVQIRPTQAKETPRERPVR